MLILVWNLGFQKEYAIQFVVSLPLWEPKNTSCVWENVYPSMLSQLRNREAEKLPIYKTVTTALKHGYNVRHALIFHDASGFGDPAYRTLHIRCGRCHISWGREIGDKEEGPEPIACGLRILKRGESQKEIEEVHGRTNQLERAFLVVSNHRNKPSLIIFASWSRVIQDFLREEGWAVDTMPLTGLRLVSWDRGPETTMLDISWYFLSWHCAPTQQIWIVCTKSKSTRDTRDIPWFLLPFPDISQSLHVFTKILFFLCVVDIQLKLLFHPSSQTTVPINPSKLRI